jgi:PHD/YefM family antitoxin component YafN of YafNO toxin-antitoxin module
MGIPKIKSASELRKDLYTSLKEASDGETQVVTHKQGEPVVLISQSEYNKVFEENELLKNLNLGLSDIRAGKSYTSAEIKERMQIRREERDNGHLV